MKKLLLIALLLCLKQLNAQCPITISGDTVVCPGNTTTLTASAAANYTWMPSGINTATIAITPTASVVYTVMAVTGTCTTTNTISITVSNAPVLHFTADHPCYGSPVNFTNTTINPGLMTAWHWDFGDGIATSTVSTPASYTYAAAGCYSVALTATNSVGCIGSFDTTVYVHGNPITIFYALENCLGSPSDFWDSSSVSNHACLNDYISNWNYDFGDGQTSTFNNNRPDTVKHIYPVCGAYNITLTVTTSNNCESITTLYNDTVFCLPHLTAPQSFSVCPGAATPIQTFTTNCANGGPYYAVWFQSLNYINNTGAPPYFITTGGNNQVPSYNAIAQNLSCGLLTDSVYGVAISGAGCIGNMDYYTASVYPTPTVTPINNISVCANQTVCVPAFTGCPASSTYAWSFNNGVFGTGNINCFIATNTSTVVNSSTVDVTPSANGCQGLPTSFTISVYSYPTLMVTTSSNTVCAGAPVTLTASGAMTYTWSNQYQNASIIVTPTITTTYTVIGSNYTCNDTATITQVVTICNGIERVNSNVDISIYPNPNNGNFVIETTSTEKQTIQIIDVTGKLVLQQIINGKAIIDASSLDNGIYLVQINTSEGLLTRKIIVQR
ncbi:MAG TPA: PKD domain-containing protein [Bacteroidia bacterium]|jgi:PKD repeat protein|nr:PKD domain-containing protein [Bacteroidia bacterium]